jgi:ATP adenylyltransferase
MERLWTPWRLRYVSNADGETGCFLCDRPRENRDEDNLILLRGEHAFAILNLYPYNTAHTLIAPYAHIADYGALESATANEITAIAQRLVRIIGDEYRPEGFNLGMNVGKVAGAGLPGHVHQHVVPRWGGDTNYMTVTAGTKVMPESLEQTYARLYGRLRADGA